MGAGGTVGIKEEELCEPWLDFDCERIILTQVNPSSLTPVIMGLAAGVNVGYHTLVFTWNQFHTKEMAWDWTSFVEAGYNTNILLSFLFKGGQFFSWLLSYIDPALAWWYMVISLINVFGDFTWHLMGTGFWMSAIGVDYVSVTGDFQWHFWCEIALLLLMAALDFFTVGGLVDWYFYGVMGQTDDKFCNVWHEDCDRKQAFLDNQKRKVMSDYQVYLKDKAIAELKAKEAAQKAADEETDSPF